MTLAHEPHSPKTSNSQEQPDIVPAEVSDAQGTLFDTVGNPSTDTPVLDAKTPGLSANLTEERQSATRLRPEIDNTSKVATTHREAPEANSSGWQRLRNSRTAKIGAGLALAAGVLGGAYLTSGSKGDKVVADPQEQVANNTPQSTEAPSTTTTAVEVVNDGNHAQRLNGEVISVSEIGTPIDGGQPVTPEYIAQNSLEQRTMLQQFYDRIAAYRTTGDEQILSATTNHQDLIRYLKNDEPKVQEFMNNYGQDMAHIYDIKDIPSSAIHATAIDSKTIKITVDEPVDLYWAESKSWEDRDQILANTANKPVVTTQGVSTYIFVRQADGTYLNTQTNAQYVVLK